MAENNIKPIKVAIAAMGGQGGGVLSSWMVALAESNGYLAQYTSVPGVAQRTGATIYYIELFPQAQADKQGKEPVMALMPVPGDVDIVVAGELVEAGRAIARGIVTPEKTVLIASTHRLYSQTEKQNLGDGRVNPDILVDAAQDYAKEYIGFDMNKAAIERKCMISAILYGALAGSLRLPFSREQFEEVIKQGGVAVEANLSGFDAGYSLAQSQNTQQTDAQDSFAFPKADNPKLQALLDSVQQQLPEAIHEFSVAGISRLIDYQDFVYAEQYIDMLSEIVELEKDSVAEQHCFQLSNEVARHLALWMSYEDTIRVADLKIRKQRFERYKSHVHAVSDAVTHVVEFMHPRIEEIADTLPSALGSMVLNVKPLNKLVAYFCSARRIRTSKLRGFLLLYLLSKFRGIRRSTLRYKREHKHIQEWLSSIKETLLIDYDASVGVAQCQRLIKGYGDTFDNGWNNYQSILAHLPEILKSGKAGAILSDLRDAALADEKGGQLNGLLMKL